MTAQQAGSPSSPPASGKALKPTWQRLTRVCEYAWLWELSAAILSLVCGATIAIILAVENGKRLDQWGLQGLSVPPNAVVSFLGAVAKSAFLLATTEVISQLKRIHFQNHAQNLSDLKTFDEASRGPWGALKLSVYKHKSTFLASWAALIILAALLVGTFLQLVFSFPQRAAPASGALAALGVTTIYDHGSSRNEYSTNLAEGGIAPLIL